MTASVSRDKIEARAYEIWEAEGRPHGKHTEHWQQAHDELAMRSNGHAAATSNGMAAIEGAAPAEVTAPVRKSAAKAPAKAATTGTASAAKAPAKRPTKTK